MDQASIDNLIIRYGLISDQVDAKELSVILSELSNVLEKGIAGGIVEFGCYRGTTSLYIRRLLNHYGVDPAFHVYDSFEGLPEKSAQDQSPVGEQFKAGELSVSKKEFLMEFKKAGLKPPMVHKGWFDDVTPDDLPNKIVFAFLDGDYYDSVKTPLRLIEDKLMPGAVIVVDDYMNEALPGAAKAVDEWVAKGGLTVRSESSLGIIHLPF